MSDTRNTKIPGGAKVQKILGSTPVLIRHDGQSSNIMRHAPRHRPDDSFTVDDSFADLSLVPGDVSVQVIRQVERR